MPRAWPLVGRQEEVEFIARAMDRPDCRGVVLAGAAGVGKTRLAHEALTHAQEKGFSGAWATATVSARSIPFGALAHLLPERLPAGLVRSNLLRGATDALLAETTAGKLVLGVDDAHALDETSAALLYHLAETGRGFLVATIRAVAPVPDAITGLWKDHLVERLEIQELSRPEMEELLERALGAQVEGRTRHRLWELTRGNPLFLREVIQAGLTSGSLRQAGGVWQWRGSVAGPRLVELVQTRVSGLPPEERAVVELVAIGEPLGVRILQTLAPPHAVEALERKGLLEEFVDDRRANVRLSHPLYAETLRGAIPPVRVREVTGVLAQALEATGSHRREDILRLATWHLEAGVTDRPGVLAAAAQRALGLFDYVLAERLARTAWEADGGFDPGMTLAGAMIWQGKFVEADALLSGVEAGAQTEAQRTEASVMRANNLMWQMDRGEQASAMLDQTLEIVHDSALRDVIAASRAYMLAVRGRTEEAIEIGLAILERPGTSDGAAIYAYGAAAHGLLYTGRPQQALALLEQHTPALLRVIDETPFGPASMGPPFHRYLAAVFSGRFRDAAELSQGAHQVAIESGIDWWEGTWAAAVGWNCLMQGKPNAAIRWLQEAVALLRQVNVFGHLPIALGALAHGLALSGDAYGSEQALAEADQMRRDSMPSVQAYASLARPWTAVARGELSRAVSIAMEEAQFLESMKLHVLEAIALHDVARLGQPAKVVEPLFRLAQACEGRLVPTLANHAAALSVGDAGGLERASRVFEEMGATLHAAEAAANAAAAHRARGMRAHAAAATIRARHLASQCEGARTPALAELDRPEILTRRETEVAGMAAGRLANREIAERLGVSVRTVDNHLHSTYSKLGITGRAELRAIFAPDR